MEPAYILLWKNNLKRKFYVSNRPFYLKYDGQDFVFSYTDSNDSIEVKKLGSKIEIKAIGNVKLTLAGAKRSSLLLGGGEFFSFYNYDFFVETHSQKQDFVFTGIFNDKRFKKMLSLARIDAPVIITGDTGVGKELFAKNIHYNSHRKYGPLAVVDCAIAEKDLEAFLFGVVKGAYTGAKTTQRGLFYKLKGGTLILDNIDLLTHKIQVALLRVLENKEVNPIGTSESFKHDVRVIAISNKSFYELLHDSALRKDLFYRLETNWINIPLLKDRLDEFEEILYFYGAEDILYSHIQELKQFNWTGNLRQLKNYIEKIKIQGSFFLPEEKDDTMAWPDSFGKNIKITLEDLKTHYMMMLKMRDLVNATKVK